MRGTFVQVQKKLKESIGNLQPDQYFYIIFFGGDSLFEFGNNSLLRATQKAKSSAYDFIDSIRPAGQTNALAALERAVQIRDGSGVGPSLVYFLTDGFELTTEDTQRFSQKIANLLARFAPRTRINTIGFWPQGDDRKMLEAIAKQSGGESVFITGGEEESKIATKKHKPDNGAAGYNKLLKECSRSTRLNHTGSKAVTHRSNYYPQHSSQGSDQ